MDMTGDHQYGLPDLRNLLSGRTPYFPTFSQPQEQHLNINPSSHYDLLNYNVAGFSDSTTASATTPTPLTTTAAAATLCGFDQMDGGCMNGVDGGNGRWPRQETLTLLEVRSHLDSKFKEANQKGPLWDEVSRIMADEHGYQRSGKKCREKFENLYKYYKKTKEGKAGRQDGKHYRFFRQLEALYGDSSTSNQASEPPLPASHFPPNPNHPSSNSQSLSIDNSSSFDSSSSDDGENDCKMTVKDSKRGRRSWKGKIKDFVDSQMRKLIDTQEAWLEKMLKTIEQKEHERMSREEEWRRREAARIEQEHKFWANERAWFEARDAALMEALRKVTGKELKPSSSSENVIGIENIENNGSVESTVTSFDKWSESEISTLIHLRTSMESKSRQNDTLWTEISAKMICLGYDKSPKTCAEKWDYINRYIRSSNECTKKRPHNQYLDSAFYGHGHDAIGIGSNTVGIGPSNVGNIMSDSYYPRFLSPEGDTYWENYGVKINRGEN